MSSISHQPISSYVDTDRTILSFLGPHDLVRCSGVCQTWHALTEEDDLWRRAIPGISKFVGTNIKQWLNCHAVTSDKTLLRHFEKFMTDLQWNEHGRFQCLFPLNLHCSIIVHFGCGSIELNYIPDIRHICLSLEEQPKIDESTVPFRKSAHSIRIASDYYAIFSRNVHTFHSLSGRGIDSITAEAMFDMMKERTPMTLSDCQNLDKMGWRDVNHRITYTAKAVITARALGGNLSL